MRRRLFGTTRSPDVVFDERRMTIPSDNNTTANLIIPSCGNYIVGYAAVTSRGSSNEVEGITLKGFSKAAVLHT